MTVTGRFYLKDTEDMVATLEINMKVSEWKKLRDILPDDGGYHDPEKRLKALIVKLINQADGVFIARVEEPDPETIEAETKKQLSRGKKGGKRGKKK